MDFFMTLLSMKAAFIKIKLKKRTSDVIEKFENSKACHKLKQLLDCHKRLSKNIKQHSKWL